jgi:hypothetical protein
MGISIYLIDIVNDRRRKVTDFNYHDMAFLRVIFVSLFKEANKGVCTCVPKDKGLN